jgi:hypothetical protein
VPGPNSIAQDLILQLRRLEAHEINKVLGQNYEFWSPGLDRSRYRHYQWWQLLSDWGRRHIFYYGIFSKENGLLASCKLYSLEFFAEGRSFKIAGIGAVFVPDYLRGHSYGLKLLEEMKARAQAEDFDAIMLNSDIDPAYYARIGYSLFPAKTYSAATSSAWLKQSIAYFEKMADPDLDETFSIRAAGSADIYEMCRHHARWLRKQSFGLARSEDYWRYKIGRENYLFNHSKLNWPQQTFISDNYGEQTGGYALLEQSGPYLRVLEVIGEERISYSLWSQIFRLASRRNAKLLRSWAVMAPPLPGRQEFSDRDWSIPMILSLREDLASRFKCWTELPVPPLLELDHF